MILTALSIIALLNGACMHTRAWSNGGYSANTSNPDYGTHDWIAEKALTLQTRDVSFLAGEYHTRYLLGTEAPDNPDYIGDTRNHHVYFHSSGTLQDDAAAVRASQSYTQASTYLRAGDRSNASYYLGIMSHYISDVGVYAHTMGNGTDWGAETHHSDYEQHFESILDTLSLPAGLTMVSVDAYNATLQLARDTTFGNGTVKANTWMDANYDWSDAAQYVPSAMRSLHISVIAVASAIDQLLYEAGTKAGKKDSNTAIFVLTVAAVFATSGILVVRSTRRRR